MQPKSKTPKISVGDERQPMQHDARKGTINTQFAAALLVFGFRLAQQPFSTVVTGSQATKIWFVPVQKLEGKLVSADTLEREWMLSPSIEFPQLTWMRLGMEARKRLIGLKKFPTPGTLITSAMVNTDDINIAATVDSLGVTCSVYLDRRFYFSPQAAPIIANCLEANKPSKERWIMAGLIQQRILIETIRGKGNVELVKIANPTTGHILTMAANAPEALQRAYLFELHKN